MSVGELNQYVKLLIEHDDLISQVFVKGEISNFKRHSSGHLYFTLKDDTSALLCVMFRGGASRLKFLPQDGHKVIALGKLSVFIRDGRYQLYVEDLQPDGIGALYMAFEQLKEKLQNEGLFDSSRKQPIPPLPMKIALVTSPTGAAVRDMIRVLGKRFPLAKLLVCPVRVQGEGAAQEITQALNLLSEKRVVELIILGRGGGSIEDLWPFNEEIVARAIAACKIPVISAVGHEPDTTICDFVADLRAATPSNGAELAVPDVSELRISLKNADIRLAKALTAITVERRRRLASLSSRKALQSPTYRINEQRMLIDYLEHSIKISVQHKLDTYRHKLASQKSAVWAMNPLAVLDRGYSIANVEGRTITSYRQVKKGDSITIRVKDGTVGCTVYSTNKEN